ncbi:MAG: hypothetical protein Q7S87_01485 [Agitococcus sp.]|nr:hypothetical protein [Agitococcus sp.]
MAIPALVTVAEKGEALCQVVLSYMECSPTSPLDVLLGTSKEEAQSALLNLRILLATLKT